MAAISINKTTLKKEKDQLRLYQQFLPSLDLKRQQFLMEQKKARRQVDKTRDQIKTMADNALEWLPFLADDSISAAGMVTVSGVDLGEENVLGLTLPVFIKARIEVADYSKLSTPLWFDSLIDLLVATAELTLRLKVEQQRLVLLTEAQQTLTKRVNLFDRVLIPETRKNIRHIALALSDLERASVIRAKLAKNKKQAGERDLGYR
ncbi:MAG: V-type ATP synthase subunit D [Deltaproteobacteria bacterium]